MKLLKPSRLELYSFVFSMPLIAIIMNLIMYDERLWRDYTIWLLSVPILFTIGALSWYLHVSYSHWVEKKYSSLSQSRQRVLLKIMVLFFVMMLGLGVCQ